MPGYPYTDILAVYQDAAIIPKETPQHWIYRPGRTFYGSPANKFIWGRFVTNSVYTADPDYGLIGFNDLANIPSGGVIIRAVKNTTVHPTDIISALITEAELGSYIDSDWFAQAKANAPNDEIDVFVEDSAALDSIADICSPMLLDFWEDQGLFRIAVYSGERP